MNASVRTGCSISLMEYVFVHVFIGSGCITTSSSPASFHLVVTTPSSRLWFILFDLLYSALYVYRLDVFHILLRLSFLYILHTTHY